MFKIKFHPADSPWSTSLGMARALIALGTFLTILFNDTNSLFFNLINQVDTNKINLFHYKYSLFVLLKDHLILARIFAIGVLLTVIYGWRPRLTCIAHWYITFSFFIAGSTTDGGDQISAILTFLLIPIGLTDPRKNHYKSPSTFNSNYYFLEIAKVSSFFIGIQMSILYLDASISKFQVDEWVNGSIVWYWFQDPVYGVNDFFKGWLVNMMHFPPAILAISWGTLFIEILLGMGILAAKKTKYKLFILGVIFHFLIFLIHGLGSFFLAMTGGLFVYLVNTNMNVSNAPVLNNWLIKKFYGG